MSVIVSTPAGICNSPSNNSPSKMLYSFTKQKRFKQDKQNKNQQYYNIPTKVFNKTATSFGYGTKYDFTKDMPKTPSPTAYQIHSQFQQQNTMKKGFGFGNSRQNMIVTGPLAELINNKNPGPGQYNIPTNRNKIFYSIKGKSKESSVQKSPGPGNYEIQSTLTTTNFVSKYKDNKGVRFTCSAERFRTVQSQFPGPGNYDTSVLEINSTGSYTLSKMSSTKVRKFGTARRKSLNQDLKTPGPGNYQLPSEFGYYMNKKQAFKRGKLKNK